MSHKYQTEGTGETEERVEHKGPLRSRQPNGMTLEEPPVRRSWRPCQMLNQDGEPNAPVHHHHRHHHHPPTGRGPPRYSRRPPSGQGRGQSQAQSPGLGPAMVSAKQDGGENRDTASRSVPQMRPAVTRYRRHGDPNPRFRGHRQRQPVREMQDSLPAVDESAAQAQSHQCSPGDPGVVQSQDSPHQTPVAIVTPNHLSHGPSTHNQLHIQRTPSAADEDLRDCKMECKEESEEVKENEKEQEMDPSTTGQSSCSLDNMQDEGEKSADRAEGDQEDAMKDVEEDIAAQGTEITDPCSDTESAASLSMDGPLHSPPPLQSPTPPSSPDVPGFPQLDHFSEDTSMSSLPDHDLPEDDNEDCSQSCPLSYSTSCSESYPKARSDFYPESHQKAYSESPHESRSQPKSHPNFFPEPLKTSYPQLHREPRRQPSHKAEPNEYQKPFTSHRPENSQKGTPPSPTKSCRNAQRPGRNRRSHHSPLDRSVGCRLHHYDGQSDSEGGCADQSPVPQSRRQPPRPTDAQAKSPSSGQSSSGEAQEEHNTEGLTEEESTTGSRDVISLAIKDIKEAIEEVKTKTVRSPYTPDQPVEPIWVMRQNVSPTEDLNPLPITAEHVSISMCRFSPRAL